MKLEEAMTRTAPKLPTGYRVCFYTADGKFDMTPEPDEPPMRLLDAKKLSRKLAEEGLLSDICVMDNTTQRPVDDTVLNRKRLDFQKI